MMEWADNPIYQRLTKDIRPERRRVNIRVAVLMPIGISAVLCCAANPSPVGQTNYLLIFLFMGLVVAALIALQAAASAISAGTTHRELRAEEFELVRLTTLSGREITSGLVEGLIFRLAPLRYAADSMLISSMAAYGLGWVIARYTVGIEVVWYLTIIGMCAFFVWLNHQLMNSAIISGIFLAARRRAYSASGISTTAAVVVVLTLIAGLIVVPLAGMSGRGAGCQWFALIPYFLIPVVGNPVMVAGIEENLEHSRLSEDA